MTSEIQTVPIFPLPNLVFYPHTIRPLLIFEPRYKEMVAEALAGEKMIGLVQLRPGWDKDYYGNPPVYKHLSVGQIIQHQRFDDGRFDIVLLGRRRARIVDEETRGTYRVANVELLQDILPEGREDFIFQEYACLRRVWEKTMENLPGGLETLKPDAWADPEPGVLADLLAHVFIENAYDKQCILAELDVERRLKLVSVQIRAILQQRSLAE